MGNKPTPSEEEYFLREEVARLKELRELHLRETAESEKKQMRELHYLRCAKCGQKMETTTLASVEIEVCPDCGGVYLDAGELGKIVDENTSGPFSSALGLVRKLWSEK